MVEGSLILKQKNRTDNSKNLTSSNITWTHAYHKKIVVIHATGIMQIHAPLI